MDDIGDLPVTRLNKRILMDYRSARLRDGVSASAINRDLYRLSGMFSKLIQLDEFAGPHPVRGLPPLAEANQEMALLDKAEISLLLNSCTGDDLLVALLRLSTGGRWTELVTLKPTQLVNARVTFLKTKSGKKRTVPISAEQEKMIKEEASGKFFNVDYVSFCKILKMVKPDIPTNQATHILRHTFASHFVMNGGNIIALQRILGHANIQQIMTYAHLSPEYLQNAVALNPLAGGISL